MWKRLTEFIINLKFTDFFKFTNNLLKIKKSRLYYLLLLAIAFSWFVYIAFPFKAIFILIVGITILLILEVIYLYLASKEIKIKESFKFLLSGLSILISVVSIGFTTDISKRLTIIFGIEVIQTLIILIPGILALIASEGALTKKGKGVIDKTIQHLNRSQEYRHIIYIQMSIFALIISLGSWLFIPVFIKRHYIQRANKAYCVDKKKDNNTCEFSLDFAEDAYLKTIKIDPSNSIKSPNQIKSTFCEQKEDSENNDNISLDNKHAYYKLGEIYRELKEFDKSRRYYKIAYKSGCPEALNGIALSYLSEKGDKEFSLAADTFRQATKDYEYKKDYNTLTKEQYKILFTLVENYLFNEERKSYSEAEKWLKLAERAKLNNLPKKCDSNQIVKFSDYVKDDKDDLEDLKNDLKDLEKDLKDLELLNSYLDNLEICYKINLYYSQLKQTQYFTDKKDLKYLKNAIAINALFQKQLGSNLKTIEIKINKDKIKINEDNKQGKEIIKNIDRLTEDIEKTINRLANEKEAYKIREKIIKILLNKQEDYISNVVAKYKQELSSFSDIEYTDIKNYKNRRENYYKEKYFKNLLRNSYKEKYDLIQNMQNQSILLSDELEKNICIEKNGDQTNKTIKDILNVKEPDVNNSESLKDIDLAIDTIVCFVEQQIPNTSDKK